MNVGGSDIEEDFPQQTIEIQNERKIYQGIRLECKFGSQGSPPGKFNRPWDVAGTFKIILS